MEKAWIYIRTTNISGKEASDQRERLEQYCRENNMMVIGSTATALPNEKAQAQFDRALNEMLRNTPDAVVVESISKLGRNTLEALEMVRVLESIGVELHTVREGLLSRTHSESFENTDLDNDVDQESNDSDPRIGRFLDSVNKLLRHVDFDGLYNSCNNEDNRLARGFLKQMHNAFVRVYGNKPLSSIDAEFVEMPAVIQGSNGMVCIGLVGLDLQSSGEHWGTDFFTPYGVISQGEYLPARQKEFMEGFFPYSYWYTPEVENDIHVDFNEIPENVNAIISDCFSLSETESQILS